MHGKQKSLIHALIIFNLVPDILPTATIDIRLPECKCLIAKGAVCVNEALEPWY